MVFRGDILKREFYLQDTIAVAKGLLGCCLAVFNAPLKANEINKDGKTVIEENLLASCARIVESEAYLGYSDKACHSYKANPEGRTNIMYNKGGYAYIYLIYGMYNCLNVVTKKEDEPEAVLIRALEPFKQGEDIRRYSGPGKLCRETGITRCDYGSDLCGEEPSRILILKPENYIEPEIVSAKRIGVGYSEEAAGFLYRFYDKNSKSISKNK